MVASVGRGQLGRVEGPGVLLTSPSPARNCPEGSWRDTYPKLGHEDVGDAAQNSHKVEDVPGIAKIILEWGPTR